MKYLRYLILSLSAFVLVLASCQHEYTPFTHAVMRPWFDTHCKRCHGTGGSNTLGWYYRPDDFQGSIANHIEKLHKLVIEKHKMPKEETLSESELQAFSDWYAAGYPAN